MIGMLAFASFSFAKDPDKGEGGSKTVFGKFVISVMTEILKVPENIRRDLIDKARCVIVMPSVLKAALVVEAVMDAGQWSAARARIFRVRGVHQRCMRPEGGSVGFQIGGEATDFVFLVMELTRPGQPTAQQRGNLARMSP